jgi:ABC-2 type transport system permease protein
MSIKRIWAMIVARNREFFRDREAFGWNFLFPFLIIAGFAVIFGNDAPKDYKVGLFPCEEAAGKISAACMPQVLKKVKRVEFIGCRNLDQGLSKIQHQKFDLLMDISHRPYRYWISDTSPRGYTVEKIIEASLAPQPPPELARQKDVAGRQIHYLDWLFPGILGMNIMFSALYGVGFVVVRYRKNGVLKRLKATPLTAFEYLTAQMLSRLFLLFFTLVILWVGCDLIFHFNMEGSYLNLAIMFLAGCLSLTAMGLMIASRGTSEEFTNGLLNFITWPMMFLSEVWFSIEGAPHWVKNIAELFPLTHLLTGVRSIMLDGAGLIDIAPQLAILAGMTLLFLIIGAWLFSWN